MLKFLHLSNIHCDAWGERNDSIKLRLDYIKLQYPEHRLIITGDLVDDGLESQYQVLSSMLKSMSYNICPGNHDYSLIGNCYRRHSAELYDKYFGRGKFAGKNKPVVDYVSDGNGTKVMLIALDSNLETANPLDFARGRIGRFQRRHLKKLIERQPDIFKIVYFHHHLLWQNSLLCLEDSESVMRLLYDKVELILFGHKHIPQMWQDHHKPNYILSADNFWEARTVREITISGREIKVKMIPII